MQDTRTASTTAGAAKDLLSSTKGLILPWRISSSYAVTLLGSSAGAAGDAGPFAAVGVGPAVGGADPSRSAALRGATGAPCAAAMSSKREVAASSLDIG